MHEGKCQNIVVDYKLILQLIQIDPKSSFVSGVNAQMSSHQQWFGVTKAQAQAPETHKQTDHVNQQELARQVMIKQPCATCKSHLQICTIFCFSQTSKELSSAV